ncbi:MAG TPA: lactate racemase domain-containing protein, partial [Candidatus Brocadiales bacterium]|nr:lactate racemase domain-containing protein [Candidatus Brocadiales bacterium]
MPYPRLSLVKQTFETAFIPDIPTKIHEELLKLNLRSKVKAGQTVAVTAGSRGIDRIDIIIKSVVNELKALKAQPFIVPAMGGHGGGNAEGQLAVLSKYGITEKAMGVPIKSSMDIVELGKSKLNIPVYFDKHACTADHVVIINRIKPHTRFIGKIESGLLKMLIVGLGKREGATTCHHAIASYSFDEIVHSIAPIIMAKIPILFG